MLPDEILAAQKNPLEYARSRLDLPLSMASVADPTMGWVTETARALKDIPGQIDGGPVEKGLGTVALAPFVGAQKMVEGVGQFGDMAGSAAVGGYDALKRALKQMKVDAERRKGTDIRSYR
jgi:hypothetical protein